MPTGFVLMLADGVPPHPLLEVPALAADCAANPQGSTHLLSTKPVAPASYQAGISRVAIIQGGTRQLIAHAVFEDAVPYIAGVNLGPTIYNHHRPNNPKKWIKLTQFVEVDPPADIAVLGWNLPDGTALTNASIPDGQGGQYFQVEHP
jgi:hypothetical protein